MQNLISDPCGALSLLLSLLNGENIGDAAKVKKLQTDKRWMING